MDDMDAMDVMDDRDQFAGRFASRERRFGSPSVHQVHLVHIVQGAPAPAGHCRLVSDPPFLLSSSHG